MEKLVISEAGIESFYWPINPDEIRLLYLQLLSQLVHYIRDIQTLNTNGVDSAIILYHFFIFEVIQIYEAYLLLSRSEQDGICWQHTDINPWVSIVRHNKTLDTSFIIRRLKQGPAPLSKTRAPLRFVRDLLMTKKERMIRRSFRPCHLKNDIVSMSLNPLAIQYAKQVTDKVYYRRDQFWFSKPTTIELPNLYSEVINGMLACVSRVFEDLPQKLFAYYRAWLEKAIPLSQAYLKQIETKNIVPQRLWVSTTSHLWGRIVARHVKNRGGQVIRFGHGGGCGYFLDSHAHGVHDYEDCDVYVTFSENQAKAMKTAFAGNEIIQEQCPDIVSIPSIKKPIKTAQHNSPPTIKKIMYVASIYPNGHFYAVMRRFMRNHVLLDWEVRLMAQLKRWGYQVLFKPHPREDICLAPPSSIEKLLGPITLNQRFEAVFEQADLIILDDPATSLLVTLVGSDKPFIYLDFGVTEFSGRALSLLKKRCVIVKGAYDKHNRAVVDWDTLKAAIDEAWRYDDKRFYNYYYQ